MKTLYVLRHAKSSWEDSDLADFDRPLNDRGKTAAPFMGKVMKNNELAPDLILSSPAVRARETARLVKDAADLDADIKHDERIYEASPQTLQQVAASIDDSFESAMIVGHNPGLEDLVSALTGAREDLPTAALAQLALPIDRWSEIGPRTRGTLVRVWRPREL